MRRLQDALENKTGRSVTVPIKNLKLEKYAGAKDVRSADVWWDKAITTSRQMHWSAEDFINACSEAFTSDAEIWFRNLRSEVRVSRASPEILT